MLYGEESVSILTKCPLCKRKLKEAKIFPCGIFCTNCVKELTKNVDLIIKEFECKSCKKIHIVPDDGFMKSNALEDFFSSEIPLEEVYRGESTETLKKNLKEIDKQITEMSLF